MDPVYLDNNATTPLLPGVVAAVREAVEQEFGNPSSLHPHGEAARRLVERARGDVAELLACRRTEVVFTSCATESMNAAIRGALDARKNAGERPRLVTTAVEHEAVHEIAADLGRRGVDVVKLPVDAGGLLDPDDLDRALDTPTHLVSLMLANNETGVILPVEEAAAVARRRGVPVHVDAVQAVGKVPLAVDRLGVDLLSLSGHKFHAPKGVGMLYIRRGTRFRPLLVGAGQEGGRRGGTENVPGIVGLGAAAAHMAGGIEDRRRHLARLGGRIEERLLALPGSRLNGDPERRIPGVVNLSFAGIEGSAVVLTAAREGVCFSAGSACSAAQYGGSHVLEAMGTPFEYLYGAVRLSCSELNTLEEVDRACDVVVRAVRYLRSMDPARPEGA